MIRDVLTEIPSLVLVVLLIASLFGWAIAAAALPGV